MFNYAAVMAQYPLYANTGVQTPFNYNSGQLLDYARPTAIHSLYRIAQLAHTPTYSIGLP